MPALLLGEEELNAGVDRREAFEEFRAEVDSINELNEAIVVSGRVVARPRGAYRATSFGFAHFWRVRGHRAVAVAFHDAVNPLSLIEQAHHD